MSQQPTDRVRKPNHVRDMLASNKATLVLSFETEEALDLVEDLIFSMYQKDLSPLPGVNVEAFGNGNTFDLHQTDMFMIECVLNNIYGNCDFTAVQMLLNHVARSRAGILSNGEVAKMVVRKLAVDTAFDTICPEEVKKAAEVILQYVNPDN